MKVNEFTSILSAFGRLYRNCDADNAASELTGFSEIFEGYEDKTIAFVAGKISKAKPANDESNESPAVATLRAHLKQLQSVMAAAKAKPAAGDLDRIINAIEGCQHETIDGLVADARNWLTSKAKTSRNSTKRPTAKLRCALVQEYADALAAIENSNQSFNTLVDKLGADKNVRVLEMKAIANKFLGYDSSHNSRKDALQKIVDRQVIHARHEARKSVMDKLMPWS